MSLTARIALGFDVLWQDPLDLSTPQDHLVLPRSVTLTNGTGANQANAGFHDSRSLADAASETLDLHDGTLTDPLGTALTLDKLKCLYLKNTSADATLLIGGAVATVLGLFADDTDIMKLPPGGTFLWTAPDANGLDVTVNSDLKLAHDGTGSDPLVYEIVALGVD